MEAQILFPFNIIMTFEISDGTHKKNAKIFLLMGLRKTFRKIKKSLKP